MLVRAGFHNFSREKQIRLGGALGEFSPTFFFEDPNGHYEGVCVCLDGQTTLNYGDAIKEILSRFFEVIDVRSEELTDLAAMQGHFFRLGRILLGRDPALLVRDNPTWFASPEGQDLPTAGVEVEFRDKADRRSGMSVLSCLTRGGGPLLDRSVLRVSAALPMLIGKSRSMDA
jgi:hypothetical protein